MKFFLELIFLKQKLLKSFEIDVAINVFYQFQTLMIVRMGANKDSARLLKFAWKLLQ